MPKAEVDIHLKPFFICREQIFSQTFNVNLDSTPAVYRVGYLFLLHRRDNKFIVPFLVDELCNVSIAVWNFVEPQTLILVAAI
jgi:hypothetical protein